MLEEALAGAAHAPGRPDALLVDEAQDFNYTQLLLAQRITLKTGRIAESLAEHQAIMAALLARDAVRTQQCMREHFANGLEAAE